MFHWTILHLDWVVIVMFQSIFQVSQQMTRFIVHVLLLIEHFLQCYRDDILGIQF